MKKNIITSAATIITSAMVAITAMPIASFAAVPTAPKAVAPQAAAPVTPQAPAATTGAVTKDQALQIALNHAGLTKNDVMFSNVKKDYDDGMEIWEVKFHQGFYEYNYDIAVANGQIVDFDIDD